MTVPIVGGRPRRALPGPYPGGFEGPAAAPPWQTLMWWVVVLTVLITGVDFSKIGLLSDSGPDLIKWGIRAPLWYLPLALLIPRWGGLLRIGQTPPAAWLLLWSVFSASSVVWAIQPDQAVLLGLGNLGLVGLATWYGAEKGWEAFASAAVTGLLVSVGGGFLMDLLTGYLAVDRSPGVTSGPTTQGRLAALGLVLVAGLLFRRSPGRSVWWAAATMFTMALWFSGTRTAMGAALLGILYGALSRLPATYRRVALIAVFVLGAAVIVALGSSGGAVQSLGERNDPTTFSGRTEVWPIAIDFIKERPVLGYGVGAEGQLFQIARNRGQLSFDAGTSHMVYLTTWLAGGVVGFVLFMASLFSAFRHRHRVDAWVIALLPVVVIGGITEAIINIPSVTLFLYAGCLAVISRGRGRNSVRRRRVTPIDDFDRGRFAR